MFIETAAESLGGLQAWVREDQQKELGSFGDARAQQLGASGLSADFRKGYELGLQTARILLSTMPEAIEAKVDL